MMKLYMTAQSGNAYKARLLLSMLDVPYEQVTVDLLHREQKSAAFLALNPRGQVPVLEDDGLVLWDSTAVLGYVARKYGGERWFPSDPAGAGQVLQWLAVAQNELNYGLKAARVMKIYNRAGHLEECQEHGREGLCVIDGWLATRRWLALDRPTIADVACYPYVQCAPQGGVAIDGYRHIAGWLARFEALPGYLKPAEVTPH